MACHRHRASSAILVAVAVAVLAGCAGATAPRTAQAESEGIRVDVRIDVDIADERIRRDIKNALRVEVVYDTQPTYDPITDQARWVYWVRLTNTDPRYAFHLTSLERRVSNSLERSEGGDPRVSFQEYKLDGLRSDLRITNQKPRWFPCAETIGAPPGGNDRASAGVYTVLRRYIGDVAFDDGTGAAMGARKRFAPVKVSFQVEFPLAAPATWLTPHDAGVPPQRRFEWARITTRCETCRPIVMCESVQHHGPNTAQPREKFRASETITHVHVLAGLEKVPALVDQSVVECHRTAACTRWLPVGGSVPSRLPDSCKGIPGLLRADGDLTIQTDGTASEFGGIAPYFTTNHAIPVKCLAAIHTGEWKIDLLIGDVRDEPAQVDALNGLPSDHWKRWQQRMVNACTREVWGAVIEVLD